MKPNISRIGIISTLIISLLISIPGVYAFYFTDWKNDGAPVDLASRKVTPEFQEDSRIFDDRVVLRKDKGIRVNKERLVFKGIQDDMICLEVFLMELDPDRGYPYFIPRDQGKRRIRLGDSIFQLVKVSKNTLQLRILDVYRT